MSTDQTQYLQKIISTQREVSKDWMDYWNHYSSFGTWGFWANVIIFVLPLVVLYFAIDRKKIFHIGFFGFNVHVWFGYIDNVGVGAGLWSYPYKLIPFLTTSWGIEASFVPVVYMLVYQWCLNKNKNYIIFLVLVAAILAFIVKPIMSALKLFELYSWMNYGYVFICYLVTAAISLLITRFFMRLHKNAIQN